MSIESAFIVPHPPLIIPAVGRGEERGIQATITSYDEVAREVAHIAPDTIIVTSPHATAYRDCFHISAGTGATGDMSRFRARDTRITVAYDEEFIAHLADDTARDSFPAATDGEREPQLDHATYIPLYFVNKYYTDYRIVRIGLSGLDPLTHYQLGTYIARTAEALGRRCVFIASGDLSHKLTEDGPYGFAAEGPQFDKEVTHAMARGDFTRFLTFDEMFCEKAAECGLRSFQIMAGALDGKAVESRLLSYEGPFGVGYGVASFKVTGNDESRHFARTLREQTAKTIGAHEAAEDAYVRLARASVEAYTTTRRQLKMPAGLPDEMLSRRAGTFVSLHEHGRLRGCIGTIHPTCSSIAEEILQNAISACSRDPRFDPVKPDELAQLEISVDVLGPTEAIASSAQLDPKRYGVVVTNGNRRGLLLPHLEGVDTVEEQISIAKQKAGIAAHENCSLERFEVVRHE